MLKTSTIIKTAVLSVAAAAAVGGVYFTKFKAGTGLGNSKNISKATASEAPVKWGNKFSDFVVCGSDDASNLTDTILLVSLDTVHGRASIMQIPRDTYTDGVESHKYNAIYKSAGKGLSGINALKKHIEKDFGVTVSGGAVMTTSGLRRLVDAAGGVDLYVPQDMNYDDPGQDLHIHIKKGNMHLDGELAEQFIRYRKGYKQGDIGRLKAQKLFLAAFAAKIKSMSLTSMATKLAPVFKQPDFYTDMSIYDLIRVGNSAKDINLDNVSITIMPGSSYRSGKSSYYTPDRGKLIDILNKKFVPEGVKLSMDDIGIVQKRKTDETNDYESESNFQSIINSESP